MLASFGFESLWPLPVRDVQGGEIICRWKYGGTVSNWSAIRMLWLQSGHPSRMRPMLGPQSKNNLIGQVAIEHAGKYLSYREDIDNIRWHLSYPL